MPDPFHNFFRSFPPRAKLTLRDVNDAQANKNAGGAAAKFREDASLVGPRSAVPLAREIPALPLQVLSVTIGRAYWEEDSTLYYEIAYDITLADARVLNLSGDQEVSVVSASDPSESLADSDTEFVNPTPILLSGRRVAVGKPAYLDIYAAFTFNLLEHCSGYTYGVVPYGTYTGLTVFAENDDEEFDEMSFYVLIARIFIDYTTERPILVYQVRTGDLGF